MTTTEPRPPATDAFGFEATPVDAIAGLVEAARDAFDAGRTRPLAWRLDLLGRVRAALVDREAELLEALRQDLGKPTFEAWTADIGFGISEIDHAVASLRSWAKPRRVRTPVTFQPGVSKLVPEPLGVVTVIAPWNYPVQLALQPLVAAVAAGNAVVVKPSELAPASAAVIADIVHGLGDPALQVVQGGVAETTELLAQRVDHIFYTGNGRVGRVVMAAAAEHLTPVTLELGGKSPVIVTAAANLDVAARRIVWGKFLNAGQTCIAPDYVLVDRSVHDLLVDRMRAAVTEFYGEDPKGSPDYARIVNEAHFHRLEKLLDSGTVAVGGVADADERYLAPTILTDVERDAPAMAEEIFGPVLPVLATDGLDDAVAFVNAHDKPLALYVFSEQDAETDAVIERTSSGGACVNGTIFHVSNPELPFGGVGPSGMGSYHGKWGFDTFSHLKAVHERSTRLDPPMMYPPFTDQKERLLRKGFLLPDPRDAVKLVRAKLSRP
ncbi:MAG: aldehyde dehydrogenase family protein [Acidimicrobiales bacterium]|nr:aldehyde dehydrogenase family protein [Acidimicrobiales bacterium]MCB9373156.1 aldehyde dehydrogenase family protein [Microthrixaceae bacterium]